MRHSELLARRAAWMRRLAADLLADPHAAEDVSQDAAALALERGLADAGWLAAVTRRRAAHRAREEGRRRWRERSVARPEAVTAEDVLERHEVRERVARAVAELDPPYRDVLLRRYSEGQSAAEIARLTGVPASTVRGQLQQGLERLRERLRRELGDERWGAVLLPLALRRPVAAWVAGAGGLALALVLVVLPPSSRGAALLVGQDEPEAAADAPSAPVPRAPLTGRLLDEDGLPLPGARVRVYQEGAATAALTDRDGRYALGLALSGGRDGAVVTLEASARGYQPARLIYEFPPSGVDVLPDWTLLRGGAVRGAVVDALGEPVGGVRVWLNREDLDRDAHGDGRAFAQVTETDADGLFELPIPVDGTWKVRSTAGPVGRIWREGLVLRAAEDRDLGRLVLDEGGVVAGRVQGESGPWYVNVQTVAGTRKPWTTKEGDVHASILTAPDGTFRVAGLVPGAVRLRAGSDWVDAHTGDLDVQVPGVLPELDRYTARGDALSERSLGPGSARLDLDLVRPDGEPITHYRVSGLGMSYQVTPSSDGLSPGFANGSLYGVRVARPSPTSEVLDLRRLLRGEAVPTWLPPDPISSVPMVEGEVTKRTMTAAPAGWLRVRTSLGPLAEGRHLLEVLGGDDFAGRATTLLGDRFPFLAAVGDTGVVGPLPVGEHEVTVTAPGYVPQRFTVTIEADQVATIDVEMAAE